MKRVLIFSLAYYPRFVGGAEVAVKEVTDRISPAGPEGIEFDMITLRFDRSLPRAERIGNVNIHRIGWSKDRPTAAALMGPFLYAAKVFFPVMAYFKARSLHKKHRYDAMWAVMSYMGFPALFMQWSFPRVPFILTLQEGDALSHVAGRLRIRMVGFLYARVFKRAAVVQAISRSLAEFAQSMGHADTVEIIPNGVDVERFSKRRSDVELFAVREALGRSYSDTILFTSSRLVAKNGIADVITALPLLPESVKLAIAGDGPLEAALRELSERLGVAKRTRFLGFVQHDELPAYLQASDVFVRPSLSEGLGNSFIEAMAAGTPIIGTPVGGIVDFLEDPAAAGEAATGLFCAPRDPESIAAAVKRLMADPALRERLSANGRKLAAERYEWDGIAALMRERVFEKTL